MVSFTGIQRSYPPGEEMAVLYLVDSDLKTSKKDWVGLFRVGWTSSRDYYTFEWASQADPESREGRVTFAGRRLPPEDGHFYQLCFVTRDGAVRGASAPFQFAPLSVALEDMELVEISDDSMKSVMVLQRKTNSEEMESLRRESETARTELNDVQQLLAAAKTESEALAGQLRQQITIVEEEAGNLREEAERVKIALAEEKERSREIVMELEGQLEALGQSEQQAREELSQEKKRSQGLLSARETEVEEVEVLSERVSVVEGELVEVTSEAEELRKEIGIKESQVEDLQRLVGTRGEELETVTEKLVTVEARNSELEVVVADLRGRLEHTQQEVLQQEGSFRADITAALSQKDEEIQRLEQDLACMQANVAELAGAQERPQYMATPPRDVVDKGAYVALQHAYETLEKYYGEEKEMKERVVVQLKSVQEESAQLQTTHQEMVKRVQRCQAEYTAKARECVELQRLLKKGGVASGNTPLPVEQEHEEMVRNCETAAAELSVRREECSDMATKILSLERKLAEAARLYEEREDRLDRRIAEKNEEIQRQKMVFEEKAGELAAVMTERDTLRAKVSQLTQSVKKGAGDSSRCCPMCQMKFPLRTANDEFEKHVQGHFANETV